MIGFESALLVSPFSVLSILIAGLLPYIWTGYAKLKAGGYDNRDPRAFQDRMQDKSRRAHAAHLNAFEAFPFFAAAVIVANLNQVDLFILHGLCASFLVCRLLHGLCYIADKAAFRSVVWSLGYLSVIGLIVLSFSE